MKSHFASPERSTPDAIKQQIDFAGSSEIMNGLLRASSGILAILNEHRQILAVNETFMQKLGIPDPEKVLGIRPGEALNCIHAKEMDAGCGTSEWCSTCGAAIAIVACMATNEPQERKCALAVKNSSGETEVCMAVRSCRVQVAGVPFILLYMQDITDAERRASLERIFLHDLSNIITGLQYYTDLLESDKNPDAAFIHDIHDVVARLRAEIALQFALANGDFSSYKPRLENIAIADIFIKLKRGLSAYLSMGKKNLPVPADIPALQISTDVQLLLRVLLNLVINALEATPDNGEVKAWATQAANIITFSIWNNAYIPADISRRIFQQHFSTKNGAGRGYGTFSAKLISERILAGKVKFSSTVTDGTVFSVTIPLSL